MKLLAGETGAKSPQAEAKSRQADEHKRKPCKPCRKSRDEELSAIHIDSITSHPCKACPYMQRRRKPSLQRQRQPSQVLARTH